MRWLEEISWTEKLIVACIIAIFAILAWRAQVDADPGVRRARFVRQCAETRPLRQCVDDSRELYPGVSPFIAPTP